VTESGPKGDRSPGDPAEDASPGCGASDLARIVPEDRDLKTEYWQRISRVRPLALFDGGRMLNRLRFELVQAWLRLSARSGRSAPDAARDLGRLARCLTDGVAARRDREVAIIGAVNELMDDAQDIYHNENLIELNDLIDNPFRNEQYPPEFPDEHRERRRLITAAIGVALDVVARSKEVLVTGLDDRDRAIFALGECVDQGIRPRNLETWLYESFPAKRDVWLPMGTGDARQSRVVREREGHGLTSREAGEIPAEEGWLDDVEQLAIELGLDCTALARCRDFPGDTAAERTVLTRAVSMALRGALTALPDSSSGPYCGTKEGEVAPDPQPKTSLQPVPPSAQGCNEGLVPGSAAGEHGPVDARGEKPGAEVPDVGHLGLMVWREGRRVGRAGKEPIAFEGDRQFFAIFVRLFENGESRTSLEELLNSWGSLGGSGGDPPESSTVYSALSRLRTRLRVLGVDVKNQRKIGWMLVEFTKSSRASGAD